MIRRFLHNFPPLDPEGPGGERKTVTATLQFVFSPLFPSSAPKRVAPARWAFCRHAAALTLLSANEALPMTSDRQHAQSAQKATTTFFLSASYLFLLQLQLLASSSCPLATAFITRCMQMSGRPMNVDRALLSTHDLYLTVPLCACKVLMCGFTSGLFPFLFSRFKFVSQFLRTCVQ